MRIISKNKDIDVPYERATLYIMEDCRKNKYRIMASFGFNDDEDFIIGEYNTEERCIEVMGEIRQDATIGTIHFYMPKE